MKNISNLLLIVLILFTASCEKTVNVEIPYEGDKLVLNSLFRADSNIYAKVLLSQKLTRVYQGVAPAGAAVSLLENGIAVGNFTQRNINGTNYFVSPIKAKPNYNYTLKATAPNYTAVEGTDEVPKIPITKVLSIATINTNTNNNNAYNRRIKLQFQDDGNKENFYMLKIFDADTNTLAIGPRYKFPQYYQYNHYFDIVGFTDANTNGLFGGGGGENEQFITDETFNGRDITLNLEFDNNNSNTGTHYVVEVIALSKSTYRYLQSLRIQSNTNGDPFAEAATVFNNITNGFGIVGGATDLYVGIKK